MTRTHYKLVIVLLAIVLAGAAATAFYFYSRAAEPIREERAQAQEAADVIRAVGTHLVLPEGEEPTVATVSSLEQLAGQPFFANAKIGHRVLIYTQAKKAILYDPEIDRVVEVAPLSIGAGQ